MPLNISHDAHEKGHAPAEEKKAWRRIYHEANTKLKRSGTVHVYILAPADGEVIESIDIGTATQPAKLLARLTAVVEKLKTTAGKPLVKRAQDWPWSSLHARLHGPPEVRAWLSAGPIDLPSDWVGQVNRPQSDAEEQAILRSLRRGQPLGDQQWMQRVTRRYDLQSTLRPRGRPKGWRKAK